MKAPDEVLREMDETPEAEQDQDDLCSPVTTLRLNVVGSRGKRYQGDFVYHVPTIGDQVRIGRLKSEYLPNGGLADPNAALLVEQCCYLAVTIKKAPDWWEPFAMFDAAPISALYAEGTTYEGKFHGTDSQPQNDSDPAGEPAGPSSDSGPGEAHMGRKVQPPAKRREVIATHSARGD
jgi:hypothetical protein